MPQEERFADRCRAYSAWHRRFSTARWIGIEAAQRLAMIDLDCALYVEYDDRSREPLALIETARDVGQEHKAASVTRNLAMRAKLPAFVLLYRQAAQPNPADPRYRDIDRFRIKRLWPRPERQWRELSPAAWADGLLQIRAWQAKRLDAELVQAANDPMYHDEPPAVAVRALGEQSGR